VNKRSRLVVPLLAGIALLMLYAFIDNNRTWLQHIPYYGPRLDANRLLRMIAFVTAIPLILLAVRVVDLLAFEFLASRRNSRVQAPVLLREIVSIVLFAMLMASAISTIFNKSVTAFLTTGTILAAILGLALQETLGNLFAGIALHLEDSFEPGDVIRAGEVFGIVEAVRWRGTRVRTFNNNLLIVPNSMLAREHLEIFPRNNFNARILQVNIDYNVPPATVISVLSQAASHVDGVVQEMPCLARVANLGESSVVYEIKYFMSDYSMRDRIDADIRRAVWYALKRNNITIGFPIRSFQKHETPAQRQHPDRLEIIDRLSRIDILSPLTAKAQEAIADASRVRVYARGETILRHGDEGSSMFIVHEGSISIRVDENEVARLEPGDFFGEMALLTGERRTADVVALTDVTAVEITKDALQPVLQDHPDLAASISAKVMERRSSLDSFRADEDPEEHASVLSRIRAYFGL